MFTRPFLRSRRFDIKAQFCYNEIVTVGCCIIIQKGMVNYERKRNYG